jgi:hypothetical protein
MHLARMLRNTGGIPVHGNQRSDWEPVAASISRTLLPLEGNAALLRAIVLDQITVLGVEYRAV